jgi:protein disulfide-isomerase
MKNVEIEWKVQLDANFIASENDNMAEHLPKIPKKEWAQGNF